MATATTRNSKPKAGPAHKIRVGGCVATIWRNEGENGPWFNTTLVRVYKDDEGEYQETNSYLEDQLLALAKVSDLAHSWVVTELAKERAARRNRDATSDDVPY